MTIPLRMDTTPLLDTLKREGNQRASWTIQPGDSDLFFKCVCVKMLDAFDSGGNHNVYVEVINDKGDRIAASELDVYGFSLAYSTNGDKYTLTPFEKKAPEAAANFPLYAGNNAACMVKGSRQYTSDIVKNLVMPGRDHKSYIVVFQLQKAGQVTPPVVTPPTQPGTINVPVNVIIEVEQRLKQLQQAVDKLR